MTQTNTYQLLCDSVGAYEATYTYDIEGINWFGGIFTQTFTKKQFKEDAWRWTTKEYRSDRKVVKVNKKMTYPPATADQRERLEELILDKRATYITYMKTDVSGEYTIQAEDNCRRNIAFVLADTKFDALYALTQKLRDNGVLSDEELKEALTNV